MPRKRTGYDAACYYDGKLLGRCTKADSDAYTLLMNACGGDAARVLREYAYFSPELRAILENAALMQADRSRTGGMFHAPKSSPWGEVQNCETLCPGVFLVSTASHGGTMVANEVAAVLSPAAKKCGFKDKGYICYEEDAQESVVLRVLLDINLPDGNGFELCKLIKPQHPDTIVIFLTANDQESDQIRGYEVGAVDYITKPFVIGALQRKIKAMFAMLEHHKPAKDIYDDGRLFLDFSEQTASLNGKPLTLSPMEYKMLNLFRKNPRQVLTRGQLLEKLWDIDERFVDEHTLTTSISRIRSKIESDGGAPYIKTVYGMGYQWTGGEAK